MNDELSYAEMLEIPVETVTVNKRERHRKSKDLPEKLIDEVNERVEADPSYAESRTIEREYREPKSKLKRGILIGEFVAVVLLCATIFLTNLFMTDSAINTFVRGLFEGNASAADTRTYSDFVLSPVVNDYTDAEIAVSDTGVLSFTAKCSVYAPAAGTVESVSGNAETGYSVRLRHSDTFTTIISGLDDVYPLAGETVRTNIPLAYSDGEGAVRVMFYEGDTLLSCHLSDEGAIAWS